MRATMSTPEPAGNPMMIVIGRAGHDCADATAGSRETTARSRMSKVMTKQFIAVIAALIAGCASYSGSGLVPGQSTVEDVEAGIGAPALVREAADGEKTLWYPRLPLGRESFAARIDPDGTLLSLEQRLTGEN